MNIRKANIADLISLVFLFEAYRRFYQKEANATLAQTFIKERLENQDSQIFVAENTSTKELAGFVQLYPVFSSTRMKRLWLLNDLYIETKYRGQGISVKLIDAAKKLSRDTGACGLILETAKSNLIGNALYPKTGFTLDEDHNYYEWEENKE